MNAAEENMHVQMLGDLHVKKIKLNSMKRKQKKNDQQLLMLWSTLKVSTTGALSEVCTPWWF